MNLPKPFRAKPARNTTAIAAIAAAAAAVGAVAIVNQLLAKRSEARHPPRGKIIKVDGVDLHYFEAGAGSPVVLIHGNGVTGEDWVVSGLFHRLAADHRVIVIDRPGFGYSARPRSKVWTASRQADLFAAALDQLGVEAATVIGHSWGTLVALRLALQRPDLVAGLGLMSGYYWATPRLDVLTTSGPAIPVLGDVVRFTLSPAIGRLLTPLVFKQVFAPAKVTETFKEGFPTSMALRPGQIRASAGDTAMMPFEAFNVSRRYDEIVCPVLLIAGDGDKIASFTHQSARLAEKLGWELHTIEGAGHMIHHIAPAEVGAALEGLLAEVDGKAPVASATAALVAPELESVD